MEKKLPGQNQQLPQQPGVSEILSEMGFKTDAMKHQSHGLTVAKMNDLKSSQANEDTQPKISANLEPDIEINEHEKHLVHVYLEQEKWDKGVKKSKGRIQKFYKNDFDVMSKTVSVEGEKTRPQNAFGQYDVVKILHYPGREKEIKTKQGRAKLPTEMSLEELRTELENLGGSWDENDSVADLIVAINASKQP